MLRELMLGVILVAASAGGAAAHSVPCQDCGFIVPAWGGAAVPLVETESTTSFNVKLVNGRLQFTPTLRAPPGAPTTPAAYETVIITAEHRTAETIAPDARRVWNVTSAFKAKLPAGGPIAALNLTTGDHAPKRLGTLPSDLSQWDAEGWPSVTVYVSFFYRDGTARKAVWAPVRFVP